MKKIDMNRLRQLFVYDFAMSGLDKLWLAAFIFAPFLMAYFLWDVIPALAWGMFAFGGLISTFSPFYFASHIMSNMRTKQEATAFAMIPATNAEKYIVRFVNYVILPSIVAFLASLLAAIFVSIFKGWEFIQGLYESFYYFFSHSWKLLQENGPIITIDGKDYDIRYGMISAALSIFLSYAMNIMIAVLGGSYFRRHPLIKTFIIYVFFALFISPSLHHFYGMFVVNHGWDIPTVVHTTQCVQALVIIVCTVVSYKLFRRRQII